MYGLNLPPIAWGLTDGAEKQCCLQPPPSAIDQEASQASSQGTGCQAPDETLSSQTNLNVAEEEEEEEEEEELVTPEQRTNDAVCLSCDDGGTGMSHAWQAGCSRPYGIPSH